MNWLQRYEQKFRLFSDHEAWTLFRLAAFAEATGWTLLITGILLKKYAFDGKDIPVLIAGQIHGTFFIIYFVIASIIYPSLRWSRITTVCSLLAGIPPYGSLLFEQYIAYQRSHTQWQQQRSRQLYERLIQATNYL